jgi:hypothetical protein
MSRPFQFFRAGGFDQVQFASGADLVNLEQLDPKLWVALACPVKGLAFDQRTLELIDIEKDGRIRANELVAASKWVGSLVRDPNELLAGKDGLPLASINDEGDEGKRLKLAAKTMLSSLGKADATVIVVADTQAAVKAFDAQVHNGDGVLVPESGKDEASKQLIADVIATVGSRVDRSGKQGISIDQVADFFTAIGAHAAWLDKADAAILPLGADTAAAFDALEAVRAKVDDYFTRTKLAAFDARALNALNRDEKDFLTFTAKELTVATADIVGLPLARVEAGRALPLTDAVNPAWAAPLAAFHQKVVTPLLGEMKTLSDAQWTTVTSRFAPFEAWQAAKAGAVVEKLGAERVKALTAKDVRAPLDALFADEKAQEPTANSIHSVEKLTRCYRDLHSLAVNFVNFREFYSRKKPATFQVGTLYLDQRSCELCLRVDDAGRHASMAPLARAYLAYCEVSRPATGEKMSIVAAFTAGDSDNLMVGRNGVFVDRDGKDWDATITKLVDNPISIRAAFFSPYKKLIRFVEEQVASRAAAADKEANDSLTGAAVAAGKTAETGKVEEKKKPGFDVGVVAALGVAVGGITAALGALLQAFFGLGMWMPLGLMGLVLLISGPSMLIAWLKLRQRNIGPLLEANGWAINANARMNLPFGASLTKVAVKPEGSRTDTVDPFEEARKPWGLYLFLVVLLSLGVAYYLGKLDGLLPGVARSTTVLGDFAPAKPSAAPAAVPAPAPATAAPAPAAK